ncbi:MAG: cold shock domain-containing protein [Balneolaceae bacterium]|jgi:CspA family cold shock protein|nr:cold shock domain-containing protein [Balneolaceae bacterium]
MENGKVKWFNEEKGFGFITPETGGKDIFVHRNNVENLASNESLKDGDDVEYSIQETPKGLNAVEVYVLE